MGNKFGVIIVLSIISLFVGLLMWEFAYVKTEFQTLVELVNHQCLDGRSIKILLAQMVVHTSGCTDDDGRLDALHGAVLFHSRSSTVAAHHLVRCVHTLEDLVYL